MVSQAYSERDSSFPHCPIHGAEQGLLTDVIVGGVLGADAEANDELFVDGGGHHVQFAGRIDGGKKHLVQLVAANQAKAHQSDLTMTDSSY